MGLGLAQTLVGHLPGKRWIIPLLVLPAVTAPIVVGHTWRMLYDVRYGPINQVLSILAGQPLNIVWLSNVKTVYPAVLAAEIWQWTPFMFLVLLAGLSSVNLEYQEAAAIDGASAWQIFWHITLPIARPVMIVALLIRGLDVFRIFDIIFAMTGGGPGTMTETASYYVWVLGFRNFRLGYAAAASYLLMIVISVGLALLLSRLGGQEE